MDHDHDNRIDCRTMLDSHDWVLIVEALAVWDVERNVEDDRALRARELSAFIANRHGYLRPSSFVYDSLPE